MSIDCPVMDLYFGIAFVALGGVAIWRMFLSPRREASVVVCCPMCSTHYAVPGRVARSRDTRLRCRVCRGVFEVTDDEGVASTREAATRLPRAFRTPKWRRQPKW